MEGYFKNKSIFNLIIKWKYHLIVILFISVILSVFFSSSTFITPKYKSFAVVYPVNLATYSEESETEQMLQIMKSYDIRNELYKKLDLIKHYGINPTDKQYLSLLNNKFDNNVSFSKTEFESVEISVLDEDPLFASNLVDSIISFYDQKVASLHKSKYKEVININKYEIIKKKVEIDSLNKLVTEFRTKYGILDYKIQTEEVSKHLGNNNKDVANLTLNLKEKGGEYLAADSLLWKSWKDYTVIKRGLEMAEKEYNKQISYVQKVTNPYPADKKSYPIRWLIILVSSVGVLFASLIIISVVESKKSNS